MSKIVSTLPGYLQQQAERLGQLETTSEEGAFRERPGLGTSDPPTAGELTAAFGAPATLPVGFRAVVESATNLWYIVFVAGGGWQVVAPAAAGLLWNVPYAAVFGRVGWFELALADGLLHTLLPAGTVTGSLDLVSSVILASDGNTHNERGATGFLSGLLPGGAAQTIYNDAGGNTVDLAVTAPGAVTLQRTAGVLTYGVAINLLWI